MSILPPKKIVIMGPFGLGNLGDAAIQKAMIQNIFKKFPSAQVFGISMNPSDTEQRHGISAFPIGRIAWGWGLNKSSEESIFYRLLFQLRTEAPRFIQIIVKVLIVALGEIIGLFEAYSFIKDKDVLIISGGGQLDDYWGGAWDHPYALMAWAILAKLGTVPYRIVSVGAGPLDSRLSRLFDWVALTVADYRSYRDEKSRKYIEKVTGFVRNDPVYPDLAFSLQGVDEFRTHPPQPHVCVGISPMIYFDPRFWPEKDQNIYTEYLNKLALFIKWLVQNQYEVVLFPGDMGDIYAINDLKKILADSKDFLNLDMLFQPTIRTVEELMMQLSRMDFVITSRFHGVLLSKLLYKPVIAISYHEKIDELMAGTGQSKFCLQIDRFDFSLLKEKFIDLESNKEIVNQMIAQRVNEYQTALGEQYEEIFKNL